jgi:hypothetical protein
VPTPAPAGLAATAVPTRAAEEARRLWRRAR